MNITPCLLVFVVLVGADRPWDYVITNNEGDIILYQNEGNGKTKENKVADFSYIDSIIYNELNHKFYLIIKNYFTHEDELSSFSMDGTDNGTKLLSWTSETEYDHFTYELAFDPATNRLYWSDTLRKSIFWISLDDPQYQKNLFIHDEDKKPHAIAIDSCRGNIYWSYISVTTSLMERARLDLSDRKTILDTEEATSIAIDQKAGKLYWVEFLHNFRYSIVRADLDGTNKVTWLVLPHIPMHLNIGKDDIYWMDVYNKIIYKYSKNAEPGGQPERISNYMSIYPRHLIVNNPLREEIVGVPECDTLKKRLDKDINLVN